MTNRILIILAFSSLLVNCKTKKTLFEKLDSGQTNITFNNTISVTDSLNALKFEYIYNGAGVGVGDFNNDKLTDVFFAGNQVSSKLYLNKGDFEFEDVTEVAKVSTDKWCTGVSVVDINQDGKQDIFVSTISNNFAKTVSKLFFINQGNDANGVPVFKESAAELGLADLAYGTQAAFFDYDLDGDLDAYLLTNALEKFNRSNSAGQRSNGDGRSIDKLYQNTGIGPTGLPLFKDVSKEAGILVEGWGLGIIVNDINKDGYPDIYVGNDFLSNDHLYINNKNGTFSNEISKYLKHQSMNSMGLDMADINNDGLNDLVVVDMLPDDNLRQKTMFGNLDYDRFQENLRKKYQPQYVRNVLQVNNGNNTFSDVGYFAGIAATDWSWSPLIADFDNDGLRDIYITNGYRLDVTDLDFIVYRGDEDVFAKKEEKEKRLKEAFATLKGVDKSNFFFKNKGELRFENVSEDYGLKHNSYTNGTAYADFDNDGDLDLIMNNIDDEAFVYKNNAIDKTDKENKPNNYLRLKLNGSKPNTEAYGSKISVYYNGKMQYAEHQIVRGYKSSVENFVHFGLGTTSKLDSVSVVWPNGTSQVLKNVALNTTMEVNQSAATSSTATSTLTPDFTFEEVSKLYNLNYVNQENDFNDFLDLHTIPHKHSENGPAMAVGDVNADGLDDLFIAGSAHMAGTFFIQNKNSTFTKKDFLVKDEEDQGVLLVDVDNDKDLDLYCVSGSTEYKSNYVKYQDRLYLNNGKGTFELSTGKLPKIVSSGSSVSACDFDKDGDLDLFRAGRVVPLQYPSIPESYLLRNDGKGNFTDVAVSLATNLTSIGMVKAAIWSDYNNDSWTDLVLVGEFMPITIFKNENGKKLVEQKLPSLANSSGWWNSINGGDFDNDGDTDYILGNLGLNSKYKASTTQPVSAYGKDFDSNGSFDPILTYFNYDKEYLVHPRGALIDQLLPMRRRFKTFKEYGETEFKDAIPEVDLKGAVALKAQNFANTFMKNNGNGTFELINLPYQVQLAPINGTSIADIDGDGNLDLLAIGNDYSTEVLTGRYDAGIGAYLKGNGKGNFSYVSITSSNFSVNGDAKALAIIKLANNKTLYLASQNRDSLSAFVAKDVLAVKVNPKRKLEKYLGSGYLTQNTTKDF
jgi:enediyne biosynthesis protein E4